MASNIFMVSHELLHQTLEPFANNRLADNFQIKDEKTWIFFQTFSKVNTLCTLADTSQAFFNKRTVFSFYYKNEKYMLSTYAESLGEHRTKNLDEITLYVGCYCESNVTSKVIGKATVQVQKALLWFQNAFSSQFSQIYE